MNWVVRYALQQKALNTQSQFALPSAMDGGPPNFGKGPNTQSTSHIIKNLPKAPKPPVDKPFIVDQIAESKPGKAVDFVKSIDDITREPYKWNSDLVGREGNSFANIEQDVISREQYDSTAAQNAIYKAKDVVNNAKAVGQGVANTVKNVGTGISNTVKNVGNAVKSDAPAASETAAAGGEDLMSTIEGDAAGVAEGAAAIAGGIASYFL